MEDWQTGHGYFFSKLIPLMVSFCTLGSDMDGDKKIELFCLALVLQKLKKALKG